MGTTGRMSDPPFCCHTYSAQRLTSLDSLYVYLRIIHDVRSINFMMVYMVY